MKKNFVSIVLSVAAISSPFHFALQAASASPQALYAQTAISQPASVDPNIAPVVSWVSPVVKPRFALLCIHGLGLYSRAYTDFGRHISKRGAAVYAIDVRGFGNWQRAQGQEDVDFNSCLQDIKSALQSIRKAHPGLPVFVLGESMGGAIALRAAQMFPEMMDGLISSVPAGDRFQQKRTDLKVAMELLRRGPNADFNIGSKIVKQASTAELVDPKTGKKEKVVNTKLLDDWETDPLDRMKLSAKELIQFQRFMNDNYDSAKNITTMPVLFIQGIDDRLVKPDGTWDLFKQLSTNNRTMIALPSRHLIFEHAQDINADLRQSAYRMVLAWIYSQLDDTKDGALDAIAPAGEAENPDLTAAIENIMQGNAVEARKQLEEITSAQPNNPQAHYWLGVCALRAKDTPTARTEFQLAMRLSHLANNRVNRRANDYLLAMSGPPAPGSLPGPPIPSGRPPVGLPALATAARRAVAGTIPGGTGLSAGSFKVHLPPEQLEELTKGKPAVLVFTAEWLDEAKRMDEMMNQGRASFGDKVTFRKLNACGGENDDLLKAFDVGALPTTVFLRPDGTVTSTVIGQSNLTNIAQAIAGLLR